MSGHPSSGDLVRSMGGDTFDVAPKYAIRTGPTMATYQHSSNVMPSDCCMLVLSKRCNKTMLWLDREKAALDGWPGKWGRVEWASYEGVGSELGCCY